METVYVNLRGVEGVKRFVDTVSKIDGEFSLVEGKYIVDAKSIMGILSLDLSEKIRLDIDTRDDTALQKLMPFVVA